VRCMRVHRYHVCREFFESIDLLTQHLNAAPHQVGDPAYGGLIFAQSRTEKQKSTGKNIRIHHVDRDFSLKCCFNESDVLYNLKFSPENPQSSPMMFCCINPKVNCVKNMSLMKKFEFIKINS
jgi:hypothetical protein